MTSLVIAEHDNKVLKEATAKAVTAATQMGAPVHVLVAGQGCDAVGAAAAKLAGVEKVLVADDALYAKMVAETMETLILSLADKYDALLAPATTNGKNYMPRVAAKLDVAQISEIIAVESADTFQRPIYAGNAIATVQAGAGKKVITVRTTTFKAAAEGGSASVEKIGAAADPGLSKFVGEELSKSERPELTSAKIVISGGRGMQSGENFHMLDKIADKLHAAVGASRAAVDAGFVGLSNGLGWSPDGSAMYLIDTLAGALESFDFDARSGALSGRRRLVSFAVGDGFADGMTVDGEGFLWVALYGGGAVRRFAPSGELVLELELPVSQPTSCTFGGADLRDLYITSARQRLSAAELAAEPSAGGLFRCRPGPVGQPANAFAG